ncbi:MAG TPA: hypothetical protein VLB84_05585, partial [Bacteroidia bacterium]|nr:hypothetical protein [Bacteroidia bacterium]
MKKILLLLTVFLQPFLVNGQAALSTVTPDSGYYKKILDVTITGNNTHFSSNNGTVVKFGFDQGTGTTVINKTTIVDASTIVANITIPQVQVGKYDVSISNSADGVLTLPKAFSVVYEPFHTLIDISPSSASIGQTLTVHFKGLNTNFKTALNQTITISAKGAGKQYYTINPNSVNVIDDSTLEAEFSIPSVIFTGNYNISVSNSTDGYMYVTNGFHIDGLPVPEIISLSPDNANGGQVLDVTITGNNTHFKPNGTQVFFGFNQATGTTTVNSTKVISETVIEANVTIPSTLATGGYYVYVEDSIDGVVLKDSAFYVNGVNTPSLLYISPSSANAGDSVEITLTGKNTHFLTGTNIFQIQNANNNSNVIVYSKILISETEIKLLVGVPPNTIKGYYSISLTNSIDGNLFLYNALYINGITPPDLYSVSPSSAAAGQTLDVSITGTNSHFMMGSNTDVAFTFNQASSTIIVNSISPVNDTLINANITVPTNAV